MSLFTIADIAEKNAEIDRLQKQLAEQKENIAVLQSQVDNADLYLEQNRLNYESKLKDRIAHASPAWLAMRQAIQNAMLTIDSRDYPDTFRALASVWNLANREHPAK